mgnify:CR=1 FL=1
MTTMRTVDAIALILEKEGATEAFGLPGAAINPLYSAMKAHGGIRHSHAPTAGSTITWKSLFTLGLAGGLIPSISALRMNSGVGSTGSPMEKSCTGSGCIRIARARSSGLTFLRCRARHV